MGIWVVRKEQFAIQGVKKAKLFFKMHENHYLPPEQIAKYQFFCELYEIPFTEEFVRLYEIEELMAFLPPNPTQEQKTVFKNLIGVESESIYVDYQKSTNTFELLMQWQEQTNSFGDSFFKIQGI